MRSTPRTPQNLCLLKATYSRFATAEVASQHSTSLHSNASIWPNKKAQTIDLYVGILRGCIASTLQPLLLLFNTKHDCTASLTWKHAQVPVGAAQASTADGQTYVLEWAQDDDGQLYLQGSTTCDQSR